MSQLSNDVKIVNFKLTNVSETWSKSWHFSTFHRCFHQLSLQITSLKVNREDKCDKHNNLQRFSFLTM